MPTMNLFVGCGNLTRDPELRYAPSGTAICNFTIAINHVSGGGDTGREKKEETLFLRCSSFQKTAELANTHCRKGDPILVTGRIQQREWEDDSGAKRQSFELVVERLQFLAGRRDQSSSGSTKSRDDSSASF